MAFWSKDTQVRIDETVAFILSKIPAPEQAVAKRFLENWIRRNYPQAEGLKAFSEALSTRSFSNVGNKDERAARRALVILRGDMLNASSPLWMRATTTMAMPSGQVVPALMAMIPAFRLFAQQEENVNTLLRLEFDELRATPQAFLQDNIVVMQSSPGVAGAGKAEDHRFYYDYSEQLFKFMPAGGRTGTRVNGQGIVHKAINVPETFWFDVPGRGLNPVPGNFGRITATQLTGADMMVTSAFSGCSFCFKENAGATYAAHISPDGTQAMAGPSIGPAPALAMQLGGPAGTGNFYSPIGARAGALSVFGRGFSNLAGKAAGYAVQSVPGVPLTQNSMYVMGVQINGAWRLIFQENNAGVRTVGRLN
jgi:hypothetical protein